MDKSTQNTLLVVGGIAVVFYLMSKKSSTVVTGGGGCAAAFCSGVCASLSRESCVQGQAMTLSCQLQQVICSI